MASKKEYLDFVMEQLSGLEGISYRAMMGEYPDAPQEMPYDGAKTMLLVTEIENKNYLRELILAMYEDLSETKKKSKKKGLNNGI